MRHIEFNNQANILDVGCGSGQSLRILMNIGYLPFNMYGIDNIEERIDDGVRRFPNINFKCGDACSMNYADSSFDLVMESTLFITIKDDIAVPIAEEMMRVVKPNGHILLIDWQYDYFHKEYKALNSARIKKLFPKYKIITSKDGSLIPPIGYYISRNLPQLYFLIQWAFPVLVGQKTTILMLDKR